MSHQGGSRVQALCKALQSVSAVHAWPNPKAFLNCRVYRTGGAGTGAGVRRRCGGATVAGGGACDALRAAGRHGGLARPLLDAAAAGGRCGTRPAALALPCRNHSGVSILVLLRRSPGPCCSGCSPGRECRLLAARPESCQLLTSSNCYLEFSGSILMVIWVV